MSELTLREFQQWMKAQILPGQLKPAVADPLNPQRGTPGRERMAVYAGGYLARMHAALEEVFEATRHVLGEKAFHEIAEGYARTFPSRDYNLSFAGRHLPEFLKTGGPAEGLPSFDSAQDGALSAVEGLPFLSDLAHLEWRVCEAFHAFEQAPMDPAQLAAVSPEAYERLQLFFQPSVSVVESAWPILDIWQARKLPRDAININLIDRPQRVLVYRREIQVLCEPVTAAQCALLQALLQGKTLGEACERIASEEAQSLTQWFAYWVSLGLVTRCKPAK